MKLVTVVGANRYPGIASVERDSKCIAIVTIGLTMEAWALQFVPGRNYMFALDQLFRYYWEEHRNYYDIVEITLYSGNKPARKKAKCSKSKKQA